MRVTVHIRVGKKIYSSNSNEAIKKKKKVVKQKVEAKGFCIKKKKFKPRRKYFFGKSGII